MVLSAKTQTEREEWLDAILGGMIWTGNTGSSGGTGSSSESNRHAENSHIYKEVRLLPFVLDSFY